MPISSFVSISSFGGITSSDSIPTPEFERKQARLSIIPV